MCATPEPDPFHMHRTSEVVLVLRLLAPASLPRRFACCPAGRFWAVLLPSAVAHVGCENLPAAQALGFALVGHGSPGRGACCQPEGNAHQQSHVAAASAGQSRGEQDGRDKGSEEDGPKKNPIFRLTDLHGNQLAADTTVAPSVPLKRGSRSWDSSQPSNARSRARHFYRRHSLVSCRVAGCVAMFCGKLTATL